MPSYQRLAKSNVGKLLSTFWSDPKSQHILHVLTTLILPLLSIPITKYMPNRTNHSYHIKLQLIAYYFRSTKETKES
jgi:hypothetical protein